MFIIVISDDLAELLLFLSLEHLDLLVLLLDPLYVPLLLGHDLLPLVLLLQLLLLLRLLPPLVLPLLEACQEFSTQKLMTAGTYFLARGLNLISDLYLPMMCYIILSA